MSAADQLAKLIADPAAQSALWGRVWDAYHRQYNKFRDQNPGWKAFYTAHHSSALDAALQVFGPEVIELAMEAGRRQAARFIANEIRCELVCCRIFEQLAPLRKRMEESDDGGLAVSAELTAAVGEHGLCYWGEAAARLAEGEEEKRA